MRHFDLSPLYRSTVGFDRMFSLLDSAANGEMTGGGYPPYNIERTAENSYRISMAVAGFSDSELNVEVKEHLLSVRGEKAVADTDEKREFLHQGIAERTFERRFQLADHVNIVGASLENGLLHIDLEREIPEAKKPRSIEIATSAATAQKIIEG
ncbi:MAG: Hsp20 family protein [Pseudomonadota bacterium]